MNTTDWNTMGMEYSTIHDARRDTVFPFLHEHIRHIQPHRLLDYGGGDGIFAVACADLPISEIVIYDPALKMAQLAKKNSSGIPHIKVVETTKELQPDLFDVITLNAVWMCLPTHDACLNVLKDINRLLKPDGYFIASVTHPCFHSCKFSTQTSDFDPRDYLNDGVQFNVKIFDGHNEIQVVDTHWTLSAMSRQLKQTNFVIDEIIELPDKNVKEQQSIGSLWALLFAKKVRVETTL